MKIHCYCDGANKTEMLKRYAEGFTKGFTTNPTLMAKAGISDYAGFAKDVLASIKTMPISFEVFSDDFDSMHREAKIINSWAPNVNVKIPITNTKSQSAIPLIKNLFSEGMKLNVTALFTEAQIKSLRDITTEKDDVIVSIFAGRIADTGVDPIPVMKYAVELFKNMPKAKILWASPREVFNYYQADQIGCHIITMTDDQITKIKLQGKNLAQYSLETVQMFYNDAQKAGFRL